MRGALVCFVGADASGKSTIIQKFLDSKDSDSRWVVFKYPNRKTPSGIKIDKILKGELKVEKNVELKLFADNRSDDKKIILDLLNVGINVILDRYTYCAIAYLMTEQYYEVINSIPNNLISKDYTFSKIIRYDKGLLKPDITFVIYGNFLYTREKESLEKYDYNGKKREILYNNYITCLLNTQSKFSFIDNSLDDNGKCKDLEEIVSDIKVKIDRHVISYLSSEKLTPPVDRF